MVIEKREGGETGVHATSFSNSECLGRSMSQFMPGGKKQGSTKSIKPRPSARGKRRRKHMGISHGLKSQLKSVSPYQQRKLNDEMLKRRT